MVYWVIPMKGEGVKGIVSVGSGEPTEHDMVKAMLVFSNKNIEAEENIDEIMGCLVNDFEIFTEDLNDDFIAIKMRDKTNNRELTIGTGTKRYGVIDFNAIYEVYDLIKAQGFYPYRMEIWRWRRYRIYFKSDRFKDIHVEWDDRYGHHKDKYTVNLFLENTFDRGGAFKIGTYIIRKVCQNGLFGKGEISVSVRHYARPEFQIEKIINGIDNMVNRSIDTVIKYSKVFIDDKFMEIVEKEFGKKTVEEAIKYIGRHDNPSEYGAIGKINYYDFVQGITYLYSNKKEISSNTYMQISGKIHKVYEKLIKEVVPHA